MIHADLHGKLRRDGTNAHERAEDLLTSTVFGYLRYYPTRSGLSALVSRARVVELTSTGDLRVRPRAPGVSAVDDAIQCDVEFWPRLGKFGEPDVLLRFCGGTGQETALVAIEAKLHSSKSGAGASVLDTTNASTEEGNDEGNEVWNPDQLERYCRGLLQVDSIVPTHERTLIFLTGHHVPPASELLETMLLRPQMRLAWMSWHDVWHVAASLAKGESLPSPASDLADMLRSRGFGLLDAFRPCEMVRHVEAFWAHADWFSKCRCLLGQSPVEFWET